MTYTFYIYVTPDTKNIKIIDVYGVYRNIIPVIFRQAVFDVYGIDAYYGYGVGKKGDITVTRFGNVDDTTIFGRSFFVTAERDRSRAPFASGTISAFSKIEAVSKQESR
jgi:hypothetical protein